MRILLDVTTLSPWLHAEGASVIRTLGKAWGEGAPSALLFLFTEQIMRGLETVAEDPAAAESCALWIVHVLPTVIKCGLTPHVCVSDQERHSL